MTGTHPSTDYSQKIPQIKINYFQKFSVWQSAPFMERRITVLRANFTWTGERARAQPEGMRYSNGCQSASEVEIKGSSFVNASTFVLNRGLLRRTGVKFNGLSLDQVSRARLSRSIYLFLVLELQVLFIIIVVVDIGIMSKCKVCAGLNE